jgi:sulfite dehydrogenase (quinone) subunit SoeC
MHPALSVILFTTLAGAGQGLFLALFLTELAGSAGWLPPQDGARFFGSGIALALALLGAGLIASFFHLGHPERAWRAAAMWRTSWLSREVIVLPAFMALVFAYGAAHWTGAGGTAVIGMLGVVVCLLLFVCTGMIYACLKFLQEWATPLTVINYILLGCASGFTLAAAFSGVAGGGAWKLLGAIALALTVLACATRVAALARNVRLRPRSTLQTATGIGHPKVVQKSQGFTGGSFNNREFFHGRTRALVRTVKWAFLVLAFVLPALLLAASLAGATAVWLVAAFAAQYTGLLAERWYFFADANHPQNLYYQAVS